MNKKAAIREPRNPARISEATDSRPPSTMKSANTESKSNTRPPRPNHSRISSLVSPKKTNTMSSKSPIRKMFAKPNQVAPMWQSFKPCSKRHATRPMVFKMHWMLREPDPPALPLKCKPTQTSGLPSVPRWWKNSKSPPKSCPKSAKESRNSKGHSRKQRTLAQFMKDNWTINFNFDKFPPLTERPKVDAKRSLLFKKSLPNPSSDGCLKSKTSTKKMTRT